MHRTLLAILASFILFTASAGADVVPPEPQDCPPGSVGRTCHGGPYCGVHSCSTPCPAGTTCKPTQLCIAQFDCYGKLGPSYVDSVKGTCAGGSACAAGACQTLDACVPTAAKPDATTPLPDGKTSQLDGKSAQADAKGAQPDTKSQQVDSKPGATAPSSNGCSCELRPGSVGAAAFFGLLVVVGIVLASTRRRRR